MESSRKKPPVSTYEDKTKTDKKLNKTRHNKQLYLYTTYNYLLGKEDSTHQCIMYECMISFSKSQFPPPVYSSFGLIGLEAIFLKNKRHGHEV